MQVARIGGIRLLCLAILSILALLPGLGSLSRLTYHEAFVAQGAREIIQSGNWWYPTIGGLPWLEKPPLPWWLVAGAGSLAGNVNETVARLPSALAAIGLVMGVAVLGARHYGSGVGLLAGAIQATTAWTVFRGRLAEADILLACLFTWAIVAFDRIGPGSIDPSEEDSAAVPRSWRFWRWTFMVLLGSTALVKGIGFGAVLIGSVVAGVLLWQRDNIAFRRLRFPAGWSLAALIALAWPVVMVAWHGHGALSLWTMHVSDRLVRQHGPGPFAGETWWEFGTTVFAQALPWAPLALPGAGRSLLRALAGNRLARNGSSRTAAVPAEVIAGDRLLWVWAFVPLGLLALAPIKNAHYAISAQVPWSIWAALSLVRLGERLRLRGFQNGSLIRLGRLGFVSLALAYGLGLWLLGPWLDRRGAEWAFYETAGRQIPVDVPLTLLYDDWDRNPYESPFDLIPHDLAVRLFYLDRRACWHVEPGSLLAHDHIDTGMPPSRSRPALDHWGTTPAAKSARLAVIGRDRDLPVLEQLGQVECVAHGPSIRSDRTYSLFYITRMPADDVRAAGRAPTRTTY